MVSHRRQLIIIIRLLMFDRVSASRLKTIQLHVSKRFSFTSQHDPTRTTPAPSINTIVCLCKSLVVELSAILLSSLTGLRRNQSSQSHVEQLFPQARIGFTAGHGAQGDQPEGCRVGAPARCIVFEQIMLVYLDLCLETHRSREAKDGLHQYRNLSQSQAPGSLEKVIFYLMNNAEKACSDAKASVDAEQLANAVVDDEADADGLAAQSILLSTMSVDPAKNQRDSTLLLPALKFLWETYRAILDILRSNSKLELVYHAAAQEALKFCRVYHRRSEFRHLCEMLRQHLGNLRQFGAINTVEPVEGVESRGNNKVGVL
jgi:hypothetical protein